MDESQGLRLITKTKTFRSLCDFIALNNFHHNNNNNNNNNYNNNYNENNNSNINNSNSKYNTIIIRHTDTDCETYC